MRIIAGRWRGRTIRAPRGTAVRPTGDRAREAWMMMVHGDLPGARVLDLCAGSGALGLEALSRGAATVDFVEVGPASLRTIRENCQALGAGEQVAIRRADAVRLVETLVESSYDVAFADPPWDSGLALQLAERWLAVPFARVFGVEHRAGDPLPRGETRSWGDTAVTLYRVAAPRS